MKATFSVLITLRFMICTSYPIEKYNLMRKKGKTIFRRHSFLGLNISKDIFKVPETKRRFLICMVSNNTKKHQNTKKIRFK